MPQPQQTHRPLTVYQPYTRPMQTSTTQVAPPTAQQVADVLANSESTNEVIQCLMGLIPRSYPRGTSPGEDYYLQAAEVALLNIVPAIKASSRPFTLQGLSSLFVRPSDLQQLQTELPPSDAKTALAEYLSYFHSARINEFDSKRFKETLGGLAARLHQAAEETK